MTDFRRFTAFIENLSRQIEGAAFTESFAVEMWEAMRPHAQSGIWYLESCPARLHIPEGRERQFRAIMRFHEVLLSDDSYELHQVELLSGIAGDLVNALEKCGFLLPTTAPHSSTCAAAPACLS